MKEEITMPRTRCAIVGMSAILPDSVSLSAYWDHIVQKRDLISDVPPSHWLKEDYGSRGPDPELKTWCTRGGFLPKVPFDPIEFGIPPAALSATDTVQLLTLMAARDVLHDTLSFRENRVDRKRTGVIIGAVGIVNLVEQMCAKIQRPVWVQALRRHGLPESQVRKICDDIEKSYPDWTENTFPGSLSNVIAGRVANRFDLGGTSCTVDAACASSLAAVRLAVHELQSGTMDLVITGGADAMNSITMFMSFTKTPALSLTNDCRPYAQTADGVLLGEGIGLLALKRLEDAERDGDRIYAVVAGIGSSSDGIGKSIYAPSAKGQALALRRAYDQAGFPMSDVELIEGHGTATSAGDAAELDGLKLAAGSVEKRQTCALGSVKSQIGHLKAAAGAAGLIKAVMALRNGVLPATLKVPYPNPAFTLPESLFYLNTETRPWIHSPRSPRRAGVSAMGFGGTNFHLVLEEYRNSPSREYDTLSPVHLLLFSGSDSAKVLADAEHCLGSVAPNDLWRAARESQSRFSHLHEARLAMVVTDFGKQKAEFLNDLAAIRSNPATRQSKPGRLYFESGPPSVGKTAWIFAGQGSQYVGMGAELLIHFPLARAIWDQAADLISDHGLALHQVTFPIPAFDDETRRTQESLLRDTKWAQPAIGATAAAHIALLRACGLAPDHVAGHSYGELPALHAAGVITSLADLLRISRKRGEVMAQSCPEKGAMTSVLADRQRVAEVLANSKTEVSIANLNSPKQTVITGSLVGIGAVEKELKDRGIPCQRLNVDTCFHSAAMREGTRTFASWLDAIEFKCPDLPVSSNVTGLPHPHELNAIKSLLAAQLSEPVMFQAMIEKLVAAGVNTFIELGPGTVLSRLIKDCTVSNPVVTLSLDSAPRHSSLAAFWKVVGQLAAGGAPVNTAALWDGLRIPDSTATARSNATVQINGTNYQRRYPPANGSAGLLPPNPEPALSMKPPLVNRDNGAPIPAGIREIPGDIIESIQEKAFQAQIQLQKALAESHNEFLKLSQFIAGLGGAAEQPDASNPVLPMALSFTDHSPALAHEGTSSRLAKSEATILAAAQPKLVAPPVASAASLAKTAELPSSVAVVPRHAPADPKTIILKVVSEKTGYPVELLKMDAKLESDLGVDSIKRVEILAALQSEFPSLVNANMSELIELNTLGEILRFASTHQNQTPLGGEPAPGRKPEPSISRYRVIRLPFGRNEPNGAGLEQLGPLAVIPDNRGIAGALVNKLRKLDSLKVDIQEHLADSKANVLYLRGLDSLDSADPLTAMFDIMKGGFDLARALGRSASERSGGLFLAAFDNTPNPHLPLFQQRTWLSGLAGLTKSIGKEWPKLVVRSVGIDAGNMSPDLIAELLIAELSTGEPEIYLAANRERWRWECQQETLSPAGSALTSGDLILVTGGARGVTAQCLIALARRDRFRFAILGRSRFSTEDAALKGSRQELIAALSESAGANGQSALPLDLDRRASQILASREIAATLAAIRQAGSEVEYYAANLLDARQVAEAVETVRGKAGRIRAIVHGAGVIADKLIQNKTDADYTEVFNTKVLGLKHLIEATAADHPKLLCNFTSIAGRFGNAGQSDYAMANEVLNKLSLCHPTMLSINWGPWEGGMVTPELAARFKVLNVALIPLAGGAELFANELLFGGGGSREIVFAGASLFDEISGRGKSPV